MNTMTMDLNRSAPLRRALWADAAACLATGVLLSLAAAPLAEFLGLPAALLLYAGLALIPSTAFMAWLAARTDVWRAGAGLVIAGNLAWVAGSVLVLVVYSPTALGYAFVVAQAVVVAALAELEYFSLRRISS